MIGRTIEARAPRSSGPVLWSLLGAACILLSVFNETPHWAIASLLPWVMAVLLWTRRPRPVAVLVTETGLSPIDGDPPISYDSIRSVMLFRMGRSATIEGQGTAVRIGHQRGELLIPSVMNVSPDELYGFLKAKIPQQAAKPVHPALAEFHDDQVGKFGESKVRRIHARSVSRKAGGASIGSTLGAGLVISRLCWIVAGILCLIWAPPGGDFEAWIPLGVFILMLGGLLWFLARIRRGQPSKILARNSDACIVISPVGLAMVQGDMRGRLRWEEIVATRLGAARFFDMPGNKGLEIAVRGSRIIIFDIYDRPLAEIERLINDNRLHLEVGGAA